MIPCQINQTLPPSTSDSSENLSICLSIILRRKSKILWRYFKQWPRYAFGKSCGVGEYLRHCDSAIRRQLSVNNFVNHFFKIHVLLNKSWKFDLSSCDITEIIEVWSSSKLAQLSWNAENHHKFKNLYKIWEKENNHSFWICYIIESALWYYLSHTTIFRLEVTSHMHSDTFQVSPETYPVTVEQMCLHFLALSILVDFQSKNYHSKETWKGQYWGSNIDVMLINVNFLSFLWRCHRKTIVNK